ncbi:MAG: BON domain-containing protein [Methanomicrobiales archaeon]|nr:BON domain-containing protein [Methanomicrobiales archaeon]
MVLTDEEIKKRIVDELYWDTRVDASKIGVLVDGGKVTLTGNVPNYNAKLRAETDAYAVRDVIWVENRITVLHPPTIPIPRDEDVRLSVIRNLSDDPDLEKTDIRVSVKDGIVTLEGSVDAYWKKWEAEYTSCNVRGVCDIVNKVSVVPTMQISDRVIAEDVEAAIERRRNVNIEDLDIRVENGVVTLSGTVPDWDARRAAVNAAEFTKGVINVIDELTIQPMVTVSGRVC